MDGVGVEPIDEPIDPQQTAQDGLPTPDDVSHDASQIVEDNACDGSNGPDLLGILWKNSGGLAAFDEGSNLKLQHWLRGRAWPGLVASESVTAPAEGPFAADHAD